MKFLTHLRSREEFWYSLWIETSVICVSVLSLFCCFSQMRSGAWAALLCMILWCCARIIYAKALPEQISLHGGRGWLLLPLALAIISMLAGVHCFLDSFSYRIPQLLFWLQKGHPWGVPFVDMRINQMPHVWPFLTAPFFVLLGEFAFALPNLISFALLIALFYGYAQKAALEKASGRAVWMALGILFCHGLVMGAPSNDNVVTCSTYLVLSYHFAVQAPTTKRSVIFSALAFALCCGIKPQYLVLAPLWILWFFRHSSKPWQVFPWRWAPLIAVLLLLCSPVPTLTVNQLLHGSYKAPNIEKTQEAAPSVVDSRPVTAKANNSFSALGKQFFSLPVNPLSKSVLSAFFQENEKSKLSRLLFKHSTEGLPIIIPEIASFGFFSAILFLSGIVLAFLHRCTGRLPVLSVLALMCVAIVATTPGTLGRSFIGFFFVLVPFSFKGMVFLPKKALIGLSLLSIISGIFLGIFNPARPLWPCRKIANHIQSSGISRALQTYAHYSQRQYAAKALLAHFPDMPPKRLGVITGSGEPIAELWKPYREQRDVIPFPHQVSREQLDKAGISWVIVKNNKLLTPERTLNPSFLQSIDGEIAAENAYVSYMQKGEEPWFLVRINEQNTPSTDAQKDAQ